MCLSATPTPEALFIWILVVLICRQDLDHTLGIEWVQIAESDRAPVKLGKTGWLNCLAWLHFFFMLFTQWSGPVQPNSKDIRHRLSSDNCLDNFYFLSLQNSSWIVAQRFAHAVLRPVVGQRLWIGPCHPGCPPIRNCPSLHPCYPLLTLFVFLRAVLKLSKYLDTHLEKYPPLFPAKGWKEIPSCVWTSATVAVAVSLSIGEQLPGGKTGFPSCGCHTELEALRGGSQVDARTCIQEHRLCIQEHRLSPFAQMQRDLPSLLWLSQQPTAQRGTGTVLPAWALQAATPTAASPAALADTLGDSRAACTGTSLTAVTSCYIFSGLFFFPDKVLFRDKKST